MSDPLLPDLLTYLSDPEPERHDHRAVEQALRDEARRTELLRALAELDDEQDADPTAKALTGIHAWWANWLEGFPVKVGRIEHDLPDVDALVEAVKGYQETIRATGERHADNAVCQPARDATVIDLRNWQRSTGNPLPTVTERLDLGSSIQVRVFGFERLGQVIHRLDKDGLALINTGSFTGQTIAGPFNMGTHGSGAHLGAMPDAVTAVDILGADGVVRRVRDPDRCAFPPTESVLLPRTAGSYTAHASDAPLEAAVVALGTFGVVLSYVVEVRAKYRLAQTVKKGPWRDMLKEAREGIAKPAGQGPRHTELLLRPDERDGDNAVLLQRTLTNDPSDVLPDETPWIVDVFKGNAGGSIAGAVVSRSAFMRKAMFNGIFKNQLELDGTRGNWKDILIRNTGISAHGFEVFFPYAFLMQGVQAVLEGIDNAAEEKAFTTGPIGVRFVQSGEQWLAMNHRRYRMGDRIRTAARWVTVEVPRLLGTRNQERVPQCILDSLVARGIPHRPHWGQYFPTDQVDTTELYPRLPSWRAARAAFGADPRFVTPKVAQLTGLPTPTPRTVLSDPHVEGAGRRILVVLGDEPTPAARREAIRRTLERASDRVGAPRPVVRFMALDDLLVPSESDDLGERQSARNVRFERALEGPLGHLFRYRSGRTNARSWLAEVEQWAGIQPERLVRWIAEPDEEGARPALRARFRFLVERFQPELIVAHGLGGLVAYDAITLVDPDVKPLPRLDLLTLGTPVGHQAFRAVWGGRLHKPDDRIGRWFHLYNPDDPAFAADVPVQGVQTLRLDHDGSAPHAPGNYLSHPRLLEEVYRPLFTRKADVHIDFQRQVQTTARRTHKALLVGVNRYAGAGMDLEGCINDVYGMSELLQKRFDYRTGDVRLLTNERATAHAFRERLEWLLADARDGDRRVLYFSGHGTRLPSYNALEVVDQVDECLVLHDFDWDRPQTAFVDDEFAAYYSQLDFGVKFTAIFDCCHGGGMTRSAARVRGLTPPDDIRHRMLTFDTGRWKARFDGSSGDRLHKLKEVGPRAPVRPLGTGLTVRSDPATYDQDREHRRHEGPYLPLLMYSCAEGELSFEHQVGSVVHGAFTWTLLQKLKRSKLPDVRNVVNRRIGPAVRRLGYAQTAEVSGPRERLVEDLTL